MGVRSVAATACGRAIHWALHTVLRRSASQLPGRAALAIDPQAIAHLRAKVGQGSVVVCGTNGKTTTTNLIAAALEEAGQRVLCNRDGANMAAGVTSALLPGRAATWAVLEVDELSTIHVLPQLQPSYLVLLNLFRDQLDRAGEIDHVQDTIVDALASSPNTSLLYCGDDPLCRCVALRANDAGTRIVAFGVADDLGLPPDRVPEARFCQRCGAELVYTRRHYAQLGDYRCPVCDFAHPNLRYAATRVQVGRQGVAFALQHDDGSSWEVQASFGGAYMVYNLLAAAAVTQLAGVSVATFQQALNAYHPENGRLQHFVVDGREVVLNLAKNPAGFNQNISLMLADDREKLVHVVINDEANDGHDISWLWDVDFERLAARPDICQVMAGGHRANDLQVRFKYAGISAQIAQGVEEALELASAAPTSRPLYVLTNYSALWPAKAELERLGEHHG